MKTITPQQLRSLQEGGEKVCLLDVRTPAEHAEVHVPGVHLVPLDRLDCAALSQTGGFAKDRPVFVFCRSGSRAKIAAEKLEKEGFTDCQVMEGRGRTACESRNHQSHLAGASGAHRRRSHRAWRRASLPLRPPVIYLALGICRRGAYICRRHGMVRHGNNHRADAVESVCGQILLHEIAPP